MKNNQKLEQQKASKGCLIVAFDTDEVLYTKQAVEAANRVEQFLKIPVSIVTDKPLETKHDVIITPRPQNNRRAPKEKRATDWYNLVRTKLYDISPYDRTLVIDSDFYISTSNLRAVFQSQSDFLITTELYDLVKGRLYVEKIEASPIIMVWATVMIFNKSKEAHDIFELAKLVQQNYRFYSNLYNFREKPVRNDYIFSIACHLIGGYGQKSYAIKNYPLVNCDSKVKYKSYDGNKLVYYYEGLANLNSISGVDLHLMNKDEL